MCEVHANSSVSAARWRGPYPGRPSATRALHIRGNDVSHSQSSNDGARLPRSLYAETAREPAATTDLEGELDKAAVPNVVLTTVCLNVAD